MLLANSFYCEKNISCCLTMQDQSTLTSRVNDTGMFGEEIWVDIVQKDKARFHGLYLQGL